MMEATARQTILHNTIYKLKKRLPLSAHDRRKSLYQAVSAHLLTSNSAGAAYLHCIKDGTNIDPPYNTGNDFIYRDDFKQSREGYEEEAGVYDEDGDRLFLNSESNGRFHSDWCSMLYTRLVLARNLLSSDGVIFISIDEGEVAQLRKMCDEVFGESNFVVQLIWEKRYTRSNNARMFTTLTEPILCYRKSPLLADLKEPRNEKADSTYTNPDNDPRGVWTSVSCVNPATREQRPNLSYDMTNPITGNIVRHPTNAWKFEFSRYQEYVNDNKLYWGKRGENQYPRLKKFLTEMDGGMVPVDLWKHEDSGTTDAASKELEALIGKNMFSFPKPPTLIKRMQFTAYFSSSVRQNNQGTSSKRSAHDILNSTMSEMSHCKAVQIFTKDSIATGLFLLILAITFVLTPASLINSVFFIFLSINNFHNLL